MGWKKKIDIEDTISKGLGEIHGSLINTVKEIPRQSNAVTFWSFQDEILS